MPNYVRIIFVLKAIHPVLSDADETMCSLFGVVKPKQVHGPKMDRHAQ
jgi:peroxiredoxin